MAAIIKVENLTKQFGGLKAVNNFSAEFQEGQIIGIMGPNGAGKTTLFNMIACSFPPSEGKIYFNGEDTTDFKTDQMASKGLARTFQVTKPFGEMTVGENIAVGAFLNLKSRPEALEKAKEIYNFMGMNCGFDQVAHNLTTVDRKKLEVARALATEPKVLLLDEVMAGCNPQEKLELSEVIRKIRTQGVTLLIIEHDIKTIMTLCEKIFMLHRGEKLVEGTPEEVSEDERAIAAYLGEDFEHA